MRDFIGTTILGSGQRGLGRARRVRRFLVVSTVVLMVLAGGWAVFALRAGQQALLVADLVLMALAGLALVLVRRGLLVVAIHGLLIALLAWIGAVAWFISGSGLHHHGAVHYWLVVLIVALHFVLFGAGPVVQTFYSAVAIALFLVIEYELVPLAPVYAFPEHERVFSHGLTMGLMLVAIVLVMRNFINDLVVAEQRVSAANQRSEQLLASVLPPAVARRIRAEGRTFAQRVDDASVLFADIVGFTPLASTLSPEALVGLLNRVFLRFDELTARHGAEKVKTIGDGYMVAAGLPQPVPDHARRLVALGLDMVAVIDEFPELDIRVGISSGPVVAGVIGQLRFAWDLWGETVNLAARLESSGVTGRVQISAATLAHVEQAYDCEPRGELELKGAGRQPAWLVVGPKAEGAGPPA